MMSNFPNQPSASQDAPQDSTDPVSGKTVAEILGEIVWLMTQDSDARNLPIYEIERIVMPAILLRKFHIKYAQVMNNAHPGSKSLQPVEVEIRVPQKEMKDVSDSLAIRYAIPQQKQK